MEDLYLDAVWDKNPFKMYQISEEIQLFFRMLADIKATRMLEIGVLFGGTTFLFANALQEKGTLISIDNELPDVYKQFLPRVASDKRVTIQLLKLDSHSPDTLQIVEAILKGEKLDAIFIDGDHTYEGVKQDYEMYSPLVRSRGLIGFHDIVHHPSDKTCKVENLWKEIKKTGDPFTEIINSPKQGKCGIGVLYKK